MLSPDIDAISERFRHFEYTVSDHAVLEMSYDEVTIEMLQEAIGDGAAEIIEDYPNDPRGASCLILTWLSPQEPVHAVLAYWTEYPRLITVYRPDLERWHEDYKTRR